MKLLAVALLFLTHSVFAFETTRTNFRINSNLDFGGRTYYNCDSVESETEALLERLGATGVSAACRGGLDPWGGFSTEAFVSATFDAPTTGTEQTIEFRGFRNCHLVKEIFNGVRSSFKITNVSGLRSCSRSSDGYRFNVSIIK